MRRPQWIPASTDAAGLILAIVLGLVALGLGRLLPRSPYVSDILIALGIGALVLNTPLGRLVGLAPAGATDREPDRYANGLRFTGKWVLRAAIILMGLKVETRYFNREVIGLIAGVAACTLPCAFFVAHATGVLLGMRRPLVDITAGGTMICGASAVQAIAPLTGARREEQGLALATVFLFSVVALLTFRPLALLLGLDSTYSGLWAGLAVNDLSSAIAVGEQMGGQGGVMSTAAKSARVVLLAPTLLIFAFLRAEQKPRGPNEPRSGPKVVEHLPAFLLGYLALAGVRTLGDRLFGHAAGWQMVLAADKLLVDVLMLTVSASIGLHLDARRLLAGGPRTVALGAVVALVTAGLSLLMIVLTARGVPGAAATAGLIALGVTFALYRIATRPDAQLALLVRRFEEGNPLSLAEATRLLDVFERESPTLDEGRLRRLLTQLFPAIGELIPVRESPLAHGTGCRWVTYWEGQSGWALVAVAREPGSATPIHAHPHRLIGKAIEGILEEVRYEPVGDDAFRVAERRVLAHNELVETDGLATLHLVRAVGDRPAIDLQLRGPEVGQPGKRLAPLDSADILEAGTVFRARVETDDRPGQGGEGASAGRPPAAATA